MPALRNPPVDAEGVAAAMERMQLDTELLVDGDRPAMLAALERLGRRAEGADAAVFFYAGHAAEAGGRNLLFPVSVSLDLSGRSLLDSAVSFDDVTRAVDGKARTTIVMLDACRDNPFAGVSLADAAPPHGASGATLSRAPTRSVGVGLAPTRSPARTLLVFATAPGEVALDGSGEHSPFTAALLQRIATPRMEVRQMLDLVRHDVRSATGGEQVPWDNSSLEAPFYFVTRPAGVLSSEPAATAMARGQSVYVDDGFCPAGMLSLVVEPGSGGPRRKTCVNY